MKNAISALMGLVLVCFGLTAEAQSRSAVAPAMSAEPVRVPARVNLALAELKRNELAVMDRMIATYGQTDFSDLVAYVETHSASPNDVVPFLALGHAYLNRYMVDGNQANLAKALDMFELPARESLYANWGRKWASSPTTAFLLMGVARLRSVNVSDASLNARIESLDLRSEQIAGDEADRRLGSDFPARPYVSGTSIDGDTKAEENAWEAFLLAWASQMYPTHPRAAIWEAKARELAFHSIVRRSEGVMLNGESFSTVEGNYTLTNHWVVGNPYYTGGTVQLMRMGALAYHITGHEVPAEFNHNVAGLYENYRAKCAKDVNGRWTWTQNSDPVGDPTLFPLAGMGNNDFEQSVVSQKASDGTLWLPTTPVSGKLVVDPELGFSPNSHLWRVIQNGKVLWYYLAGSYLWHFPPASSR